MIDKFGYTNSKPAGYEPLTWAYDLHDKQDMDRISREFKRLCRKGEDAQVYCYDTRGTKQTVQVLDEEVNNRPAMSRKPSVYGEIWVRR